MLLSYVSVLYDNVLLVFLNRDTQDEEITIRKRKDKSDSRELRRVYHAYREYVVNHDKTYDLEYRYLSL